MPQEEFQQLQFSTGIKKGVHSPTQMRAYIVQNYDVSINQNPGFVC